MFPSPCWNGHHDALYHDAEHDGDHDVHGEGQQTIRFVSTGDGRAQQHGPVAANPFGVSCRPCSAVSCFSSSMQ